MSLVWGLFDIKLALAVKLSTQLVEINRFPCWSLLVAVFFGLISAARAVVGFSLGLLHLAASPLSAPSSLVSDVAIICVRHLVWRRLLRAHMRSSIGSPIDCDDLAVSLTTQADSHKTEIQIVNDVHCRYWQGPCQAVGYRLPGKS